MITILTFGKNHIKQAKTLALAAYNQERAIVTALPYVDEIPDKACEGFADNGLGVAMMEGDRLLGFLCCDDPRNNAFGTTATGTFVPTYAHGAVSENRGSIYKRLYQAAAEIWVAKGITYHAIALYHHDLQAKDALFTCGFGLRCVDAVRPMENLQQSTCEDVAYARLDKEDVAKIRDMRIALSHHLSSSPSFMCISPERQESWIKSAENRDSQVFVALMGDEIAAFIEVIEDGENLATWEDEMLNICGAYCLPKHRGKGITEGLLNHTITQLKSDDITSLGVDFEGFNLTASGFWLKYFTAYTATVTRRIN
ncbi:MAG: GNAT family N-acetyltransferase [Defluviitaleaceae bacterium]|nr:GNAT family N-acetyltransferase [Defluviitaleaceae bacterium]